jgi:hypothetical protein
MELSMATPRKNSARGRVAGPATDVPASCVPLALHISAVEEARRAGLLAGDETEHVSFRAPPALVEAAKHEAGISSTSELGVQALAMLARPIRWRPSSAARTGGWGQTTHLSIDLATALRRHKPAKRASRLRLRDRKALAVNDALLLTAVRAGIPVLTANRDEFELIQQLAPMTRFIHD